MKNKFIGFEKIKSDNNMESDHIVIKDILNKELEMFWFGHEVIISSNDNEFTFTKAQNVNIYDFLSQLGNQLSVADKASGGDFFENNTFTWHNLSRAWDRPFEEEAGFFAKLESNSIKINFFPAKNKFRFINSNNNFFISMGGPDGFVQPYQSITNIFTSALNILLTEIPYKEENNENIL